MTHLNGVLLAFEAIAMLLVAGGIVYNLVALWVLLAFNRQREPESGFAPPISILKPLKGGEPGMYEAFRSHCMQEYDGECELIFGVSSADDAAVPLVHRLSAEFPTRAIRLVICNERLGTNGKVSNLHRMLREAKYDIVLVNDSDIRVQPSYLQSIASHFADPKVGMATCLYRGVPWPTTGSRLESLTIATDFAPGVLIAEKLDGGIHFGLGSTLAMRRSALDAIGGFLPLVDYLADDYELGARIAAAGLKVKLAREIVDSSIPAYTFRGFLDHQLRWARTMRASRPAGYAGMVFTFALPWALLAGVVEWRHWWAWIPLALAFILRVSVAKATSSALGDFHTPRSMSLLIPRDFLALAIWAASYLSDEVVWRGEYFRLQNGKLQRIEDGRKRASALAN